MRIGPIPRACRKPEAELASALDRLVVAGLLFRQGVPPYATYLFKHALVQDAAYGTLLREPRRALHARITDAIESLYSDRLTEHVERLAYHAWHGEAWETAVGYLRQAGSKAMSRSSFREAVSHLEQALLALDRLPKNREAQEAAFDIRGNLAAPLLMLGEMEQRLTLASEAQALAETLEDARRLAWAVVWTCNAFNQLGRNREALPIASGG